MKIIENIKNLFRWKKIEVIPNDLENALEMLMSSVPSEDKERFAKRPKNKAVAQCHFGGGMNMRNNWKLWEKESNLSMWFRNRGVWHPDDMSAIIFKAFWCKLNGIYFDIDIEAEYYAEYWKREGIGFDGEKINK